MGENSVDVHVESSAFKHNGAIPKKYTCEGEDISPALSISNIPNPFVSYAVIVDDPDAPGGEFVHWVAWNIDPSQTYLEEGVKVENQGKNSFGENQYRGPCPPPGKPHRYFFKVFVLDTMLMIPKGSSKKDLLQAMEGHVRGKGELIGTYKR